MTAVIYYVLAYFFGCSMARPGTRMLAWLQYGSQTHINM